MIARIIAAMLAALLLAAPQLPAPQVPDNPTPPAAPAMEITQQQALEIALAHAGLTQEQVTALGSHYELDDGIPQWDVDFRAGDWEYDYSIHGETGAVLDWDKDYEPLAPPANAPEAPATQLSEADAKAIALAHAGLTEDQVRRLKVKLDRDDGILVYELEFLSGNYEYEYDIHAETGTILEWDKEIDD